MRPALLCATLTLSSLLLTGAYADEGMWTFDNPPAKLVQDRYHFTFTKAWLDHLRLSSVRLNDGGSGSFISNNGLLLTNHHVARGQLQKNSTPQKDYIKDGFYAATPDQEIKSPDLEINVLESTEDVTAKVAAATKGITDDAKALTARRAAIAAIEKESTDKTGLRSDVVPLYNGGEYWLYRYKKYTDVRIVFAPEQQAAFFGGDPDNFTYPRYDLDMAIFRVYDNGKPLHTDNYLKINPAGAAEHDLVFVSGNPGSTQRNDTMAQLLEERDTVEPAVIALIKQRVAVLNAYGAKGPEQARQVASEVFGLENGRKAYEGRYEALLDKAVIAKKQAEEDDFRAKVNANPEWKKEYGGSWDVIQASVERVRPKFTQQVYSNANSQLLRTALGLLRYTDEIKKPDGERLPGYHESQIESVKFRLASPAPVYLDLDRARFIGGMQQALEKLGPNDEFVKLVLQGGTPEAAADRLFAGTHLQDAGVRKQLLDGGQPALAASTDTMVVLARQLDPLLRRQIKEADADSASADAAGEKLGRARFLVYGHDTYPDATFTPRISYGAVEGFPMNGTKAPYKTTYYGLYDRADSFNRQVPFDLPARYTAAEKTLDLSTPLDFVATCDIIGGNSGSPVVDRKGDLVGLVFDGNIESLAGDFVYEGARNRTVAVHSAAILNGLRNLYGAGALADEIEGKR